MWRQRLRLTISDEAQIYTSGYVCMPHVNGCDQMHYTRVLSDVMGLTGQDRGKR